MKNFNKEFEKQIKEQYKMIDNIVDLVDEAIDITLLADQGALHMRFKVGDENPWLDSNKEQRELANK